MSAQKIFTPEFTEKLANNGFPNIPEMVKEFKQLMTVEISEDIYLENNNSLYPDGKSTKQIFQKSFLDLMILMETEIKS